jgi:xanthine dehydrogenase YagS FAD-binding subunit
MSMPNFSYVRIRSLKEATEHLSSDGARVHAGGTDLLGCLRDNVFVAKKIVSITGLKNLRGIEETKEGGLRIGALTTITEIADSKKVRDRYPALAKAASEVASPQLRNQGTVAGNLCQKPRCWYYRGEFHCLRKGGSTCYAYQGENQFHCIFGSGGICYITHPSDTAPALVAYQATLRIVGPKGTRLLPIEKFYVLPSQDVRKETVLKSNEILTEILLPPQPKGVLSSYRKVRARQSWDFALAGVALALKLKEDRVEKARVVLSGAAPIPWRSKEAEQVLTGNALNTDTITRAVNAALKKAETLEKNSYKIPLFKGMLEEELQAIAKR